LVRVVGREQFVRVYELADRAGAVLSDAHRQALEFYAAGHDAYCRQNWQQAIDLFEKALERHPDNGPAQTMLGRCRLYQQSPPPEDWAGRVYSSPKANEGDHYNMDISIADQDGNKLEVTLGSDVSLVDIDNGSDSTLAWSELSENTQEMLYELSDQCSEAVEAVKTEAAKNLDDLLDVEDVDDDMPFEADE